MDVEKEIIKEEETKTNKNEVVIAAYRLVDEISQRILLKDILISTILTKENLKDNSETPCPRVLSRPLLFEYEPE